MFFMGRFSTVRFTCHMGNKRSFQPCVTFTLNYKHYFSKKRFIRFLLLCAIKVTIQNQNQNIRMLCEPIQIRLTKYSSILKFYSHLGFERKRILQSTDPQFSAFGSHDWLLIGICYDYTQWCVLESLLTLCLLLIRTNALTFPTNIYE